MNRTNMNVGYETVMEIWGLAAPMAKRAKSITRLRKSIIGFTEPHKSLSQTITITDYGLDSNKVCNSAEITGRLFFILIPF